MILGASSGTGAAVARALAADPGLHIHGLHRGHRPESAAGVERDVLALGRESWWRVAEAGTLAAATEGAHALLEKLGPRSVRVFVHSIANASLGGLVVGERRVEAHQIVKTFDSMAHSFVYWTRLLHDLDLLAPGARLFALGNPVTDSLADDLGLIAAAKAALELYVRALSIELGPAGHRVNLVKFGLVDTRAAQVAFKSDAWGGVLAAAAAGTPARRLCTVEEVGRLISFLSGPNAEWFNGATIDFTGGMAQSLLNLVHHPERLRRD